MTDIDRYLTDEAIQVINRAEQDLLDEGLSIGNGMSDDDMTRALLRAALPSILARHRAEVLHNTAMDLRDRQQDYAAQLLAHWADHPLWADEAVAE